jgi:hypothetical protein
LGSLAGAHQPVVDEHAGQPLADRFVDEDRGYRAVDAARKPADHAAVPNLLADLGDLASRKAAIVQSPAQPRCSARNWRAASPPSGVCTTSGWNMEAEALGAFVGGDGVPARLPTCRRPRSRRAGFRPGRRGSSTPDELADVPQPVEQSRRSDDVDERAAELAVVGGDDLAAQLLVERLLAVADAEQRDSAVEDRLRRPRRFPPRSPTPARRRKSRLEAAGRSNASSAELNGAISQ